MTTTLRPTGPLQQTADGARSRSYDVCVNSRPVGAVELGTMPGPGRAAGVIRSLRVDEPDRRRGRGTVAALAAEEVLRGWGCDQVVISVPAGATAALRMASALGYTERSRNMAKDLTGPPPELPAHVEVRPMSEAEYRVWEDRSTESFARSWTERGVAAERARAKAEVSRRENLPAGLATEGTAFHVAVREGVPVAHLWTGRRELAPGEEAAFVYDIEVADDHRGKGYGRALMLLAERIALEGGERRIGLHVFAGNTPALRLYESLGYRTTHVHSYKPLL
ncbi:GNAT family N-acetyltransferase [Streptomyces ficellus]|uniref:GNAT family N-acetyltransferase n=1 Tax=Streptomyces ficellus TaxID=1977088 RepID=A0ABT7Z733_9ACTN|nr:GNAT family N-acetyltransferase [Streptomyces ficellus]MDN3295312.1 GNAT family N-acetyltransferase [Streptomyces ficellus]